MEAEPKDRADHARRRALRIVVVYAIIATAWIVVSDALVLSFETQGLRWIESTGKGLLFVIVTAFLLQFFIERSLRATARLSGELQSARGLQGEAEERYRALFERSLDCVFLADFQGHFLDANRAALELLGYRRDEIASIHFANVLAPEDLPSALAALRDIVRTGNQPEAQEYRLRRKDGGELIVEVRTTLVYGDGEPRAVLGTARDVTGRRTAERVLLESRNLLHRIVETVPIRVFWKDVNLRFLGGNAAFAQDAGLSSPDELAGKDDFQMSWRDQAESYRADDRRVMESGTPKIGFEEPQTTPDGRTIWLRTSKVPLRDADGRVSGLLGIYEDITERKHAESLVRENEQRFRAIVEQSISGFYVIQDGGFAYVNARFAEIFGYASAQEIIGRNPSELVAERDRTRVAQNIRRRLAGELRSLGYSFAGLRRDGTEVEVGVHGSLATFQGRPAILGLIQDISERKRAEDEIRRYVARLEQAMQSTINVVATIGELRDPYTHGHERRVGEIAAAIATEMGLEPNQVEGIRIAGYLHDVGKIAVPAEILAKPGRLTKAEFDLVRDHAQQSYEILKTVPFPWPVAEAAWQHHERLDGSGYPRGLKGDEILLEARVLAVADTLEAMASHRPYRPGLGVDKALTEIEGNRGRFYYPPAVDACLRLFREKGYTLPA